MPQCRAVLEVSQTHLFWGKTYNLDSYLVIYTTKVNLQLIIRYKGNLVSIGEFGNS